LLLLSAFPEAIEATYGKRAPNILCDHVYSLAQSYSRFYAEHHIMSEKNDAIRRSRLSLCRMTLDQITLCLGLLGIDVPERM
jgi:arginyl-tRNA synthetase